MRRLFLCSVIIILPLIFTGCKKKETSDLKSIMTTQANGTMSDTTISADKEKLSEAESSKTAASESKPASKAGITDSSQSFSKDKSKISYPRLAGIDSKSNINTLIEDNAKLSLNSFASNPDSNVDIKYTIKNQSRNRISIVYTGTVKDGGQSKKVFFTNNINLETGKSIGLSDYADPLTIANYILSDDVVLENATNAQAAGFEEYKKTLNVDILKALLDDADFPLIKENDINEGFPKVFSYESGGDIFIAIPMSHELGDYVLVKYSPSTK